MLYNIVLTLTSLLLRHKAPDKKKSKLDELNDAVHNAINIVTRLLEAASYHETDYAFLIRKQHMTCYELILEATDSVCLTIDSCSSIGITETDLTLPVRLVTELYVYFFETEGTIVNDCHGIGGDIRELLKVLKCILFFLASENNESAYIANSIDRGKIDPLRNRIESMKGEYFFQRVHMGANIPSKKQSRKSVDANSTANTMTSEQKDWRAIYNPNVEPVINLLHHFTVSDKSFNCVNSIHFSTDSKLVAVAYNNNAEIYNVETGAAKHVVYNTLIGGDVTSVRFSPNEQHIAIVQGETLCIWDISQQRFAYLLTGHSNIINSAVYSPNGEYIFSGSWDKTVKLWSVENGQCLHTLGKDREGPVNSVAVSSDGQLVAAGSSNKRVVLWDTNTGAFSSQYEEHTAGVWGVAFSSNGKLLASCSSDKTIKLWDISSGKCCSTFKYHKDAVTSIAFSPNNDWIASGSQDNLVMFWDQRVTHLPCAILQSCSSDGDDKLNAVHTFSRNIVTSIAYSSLGRVFATGYRGGCARIWKGW